MTGAQVSRRVVGDDDVPWLIKLRKATMAEYLAAAGIEVSEEGDRARVLQDFEAIRIVQLDGCDVGMIKLVKQECVWTLIQIQVMPAQQRKGIATRIIREIVAEARERSAIVRLSVLKVNPARVLYERLGFRHVAESKHSYEMENDSTVSQEEE